MKTLRVILVAMFLVALVTVIRADGVASGDGAPGAPVDPYKQKWEDLPLEKRKRLIQLIDAQEKFESNNKDKKGKA
jgi:hypothetical protein